MAVSPYLNFSGNCREAVNHYANVFNAKPPRIMTFGDAPPNPAMPMDEKTKKLVMHAELEVEGTTLMFSDVPPGMAFTRGNDMNLIVQSKNAADITKWYNGMKEGGAERMALGPQSWSKLYGFVTDKFGVGWQFGLLE